MWAKNLVFVLLALGLGVLPVSGQAPGTIKGTVKLDPTGDPLHAAVVAILELGTTTQTGADGSYEFKSVPPGTYRLVAHLDSVLTAETRSVEVASDKTVTADFVLKLAVLKEVITVTASAKLETVFESFQTVTSLDSLELGAVSAPSIGEALEYQPGVAKRSFGPGTSRPIIRGFDGNRVLVVQDGVGTGSLSYESGDHGELIDTSTLERLEIVKGPGTLLYGSNALGGVVNAVSGHYELHDQPHQGLSGHVSGTAGSANGMGGGNVGIDYGAGNWLFWAGGGGDRSGDYDTPEGQILNSGTRLRNTEVGTGYSSGKSFFSVGYRYQDSLYGVPFAGQIEAGGAAADTADIALIDLNARLHAVRFTGGVDNRGTFLEGFHLSLNYSDYQHQELEGEEVGTTFKNKDFAFHGLLEQQKRGRLTGRFGFSGNVRAFQAIGEESLAPPVDQAGFAVFALEELGGKRAAFQFGGRVDHVSLNPEGRVDRSFTGFSGSVGARLGLWQGGNFVANYTHSYRPPTLEELYNNGPHVGLLTFEIGDETLGPERANGIDLSLRHSADRVRGEASFYTYDIGGFIFLAPTGNVADGLTEAIYTQGDSRFRGAELGIDVGVAKNLWVNLGMDLVKATLTDSNTPLPRIPPLRGRFGVDVRVKGLSLKPEVVVARAQEDTFATETATDGYVVFNLNAVYTVAQKHTIHAFSVRLFNLGDELYRNHSSFIKDLAPEIGRGARVNYTLRFF